MWNEEANINRCITIYGIVWDSIKQEKYALWDELFHGTHVLTTT